MTIDHQDIDGIHSVALVLNSLNTLVTDLAVDARSSTRDYRIAGSITEIMLQTFSLAPPRPTERHACPACGDGYYRHQTVFPHTSDSPVYRTCDTCGHKGKLEWPGGQPPKKRKR